MTILGLTIFSNTLYAKNSISDTKDRIENNEIEVIKKIEIDNLIRNKNSKIEVNEFIVIEKKENKVNNKQNNTKQTTSRGEVDRTKKEQNYIKPKDVQISKNMNLTKRIGLSKQDFKKVIKNLKSDKSKFFYRNADTIYDLCEKYEINEIFFCGLIAAESGWSISGNHRSTHNYISLMYGGKLIKYSTEAEGLEVAAKKLHQNYLTPSGKYYNGKTINGVQKRFCPASDTWDDLVYGCMNYIVKTAKKVK